jgi:hypothetical protein
MLHELALLFLSSYRLDWYCNVWVGPAMVGAAVSFSKPLADGSPPSTVRAAHDVQVDVDAASCRTVTVLNECCELWREIGTRAATIPPSPPRCSVALR